MGEVRSQFLQSPGAWARRRTDGAAAKCHPALPPLSVTDIPHICNDSMQTFPPGGKCDHRPSPAFPAGVSPLPRSAHSNPSRSPVLVPKSLEVSSPNFRKPRDMQTLPTRDRELEGDQKAPLEAGRPCGDRVCSQRARGAELTFLMSLDQVPREPP